MSYKFRTGQNDIITFGSGAIPTTGTLSYWVKSATFGANTMNFINMQSGSNLFQTLYYSGLGVMYSGWYNGANDQRVNAGDPTDAAWNHILMTWSPTALKCYLNGAQVGSTVTVDGTWNTAGVSKIVGGTGAHSQDFYLAEMAFWNAILDATTIAGLAAGKPPSCFATNGVYYWPFAGDAGDDFGTDHGTVTGPLTDADHPTLISCGGGGGIFVTPLMALRAGQGNLSCLKT